MKSPLRSKKFWFNVAVALLGILELLRVSNLLPTSQGELLVFGIGVVNIILAVFFTRQTISLHGETEMGRRLRESSRRDWPRA